MKVLSGQKRSELVVKDVRTELNDFYSELKDVRSELKNLRSEQKRSEHELQIVAAAVAQSYARQEMSPAHVGHVALAALGAIQGGITVFGGGAGPPVLDTAQAETAMSFTKEVDLVHFLTPVLWDLRGLGEASDFSGDSREPCPLILVNSEVHPWLDSYVDQFPARSLLRKPVLFMTWQPFFQPRERVDFVANQHRFFYGVLADRSLQGCVRELYAAKLKLTSTAFGELVEWHQLVREGPCCGMLFGAREFWLYKSVYGHPITLVKADWTTPGSQQLVRDFFEDDSAPDPPLVTLLDHLQRKLGVRCVTRNAFLGSGATAVVFAVEKVPVSGGCDATMAHSSAPVLFALKATVHPDASPGRMYDEYKKLGEAAARGAPVVAPVRNSFVIMEGVGAGYLLTSVGRPLLPVSGVLPLSQVQPVFSALVALHRTGFSHGDATLSNILLVGDGSDSSMMWIDFGRGYVLNTSLSNFRLLARDDAETLACSVLQCLAADLPCAVKSAVDSYAAVLNKTADTASNSMNTFDLDAASVRTLVDAVIEAASATRGRDSSGGGD